MVKKLLSVVLAAVLLLTLSACGEDKKEEDEKKTNQDSVSPASSSAASIKQTTTTTGAFPIYYVTASPLNVRSSPKVTDSNWMGSLPYGTPVEILGEENGWYRISFDGVRAYISAQHVSTEPPPAR